MKIRMDSSEFILQSRIPAENISKSSDANSARTQAAGISRSFSQSFATKIRLEKALYEAMSIAQMSRSIIEKSILAASRMRNTSMSIADQPELRQINIEPAIYDMKSIQPEMTGMTFQHTETSIPAPPDITREIDAVNSATKKVMTTGRIETKEFENLDAILKNKIDSIEQYIDNIQKKISALYPGYPRKGNTFFNDLVSNTARMIVRNSNAALQAQGSISREFFARLQ